MPAEGRKPSAPQFFNKTMAEAYDARNSRLAPISDCMHFLVQLVLTTLPDDARILSIGVGTGAEILSLAKERPGWTFLGVDPSADMLHVCRERLDQTGVLARCELTQGYVEDVPAAEKFDAVLSILVAHFIQSEDRLPFYRAIRDRLKPGGTFASTEICADLDGEVFPALMKDWEQVQTLMGETSESLADLPDTLRNTLGVLSPDETLKLMRSAGFALPVPFFQAFMIRGFHATG